MVMVKGGLKGMCAQLVVATEIDIYYDIKDKI